MVVSTTTCCKKVRKSLFAFVADKEIFVIKFWNGKLAREKSDGNFNKERNTKW